MKVRLERPLHAVRPGEIFPVVIPAGEIVDGRLAEIAIEQKKGTVLEEGGGKFEIQDFEPRIVTIDDRGFVVSDVAAQPIATPPSTTRARLKKAYAGPDETGEPCKLAKGAVIEGAFADTLIASGHASPL